MHEEWMFVTRNPLSRDDLGQVGCINEDADIEVANDAMYEDIPEVEFMII